MNITTSRKVIESFFVNELNYEKDAVNVVGIIKTDEGWEAKLIVTETNRYLKKLGCPPVYDKKTYMVYLDENLEITSYWTGESCEREDEFGSKEYR